MSHKSLVKVFCFFKRRQPLHKGVIAKNCSGQTQSVRSCTTHAFHQSVLDLKKILSTPLYKNNCALIKFISHLFQNNIQGTSLLNVRMKLVVDNAHFGFASLYHFGNFYLCLSLQTFPIDGNQLVTCLQGSILSSWCVVKDLDNVETGAEWSTTANTYPNEVAAVFFYHNVSRGDGHSPFLRTKKVCKKFYFECFELD